MTVATVVVGIIAVTMVVLVFVGAVLLNFGSAYVRSFKRGCRQSGTPPPTDRELWRMALRAFLK